jgi:hypothetical protein
MWYVKLKIDVSFDIRRYDEVQRNAQVGFPNQYRYNSLNSVLR